ncbi:MAG: D-aminoacyl-tRNA deacylase [Clostridiales bacterium]|nr:D-aminoacyl-tRNA deacylase [Clostridiales bacterium]
MRAVIQRIERAAVSVSGETVGSVKKGLLIFLGVGKGDDEQDIKYIADKALALRIFEDEDGKMNLSVTDIGGELLVISQFTLYGDCRKGRRPSFDFAMPPKDANIMYERFVEYIKKSGLKTETGIFGADMQVELVNDGPVTINLDSKKLY